MNIIIAFFSILFGSLSNVFLKKSLKYNVSIWNNDFLSQFFTICLFLFIYFCNLFPININLNLGVKIVMFIGIIFFIYTIGFYFRTKILKVEKISYLLPYTNLEKIFTIILSFFIFGDISIITFFIIIFTIFIIIIFSIDKKNLTFSKNILIFCFAQILYAIGNLFTGYALLEITKGGLGVSSFSFIVNYLIIGTIILFIPFLILRWFLELKNIEKEFYINMLSAGSLSWISWFLSLVVVSNLGLSMSILLSFLGVFTTLIFAFSILREKIESKDVILSIMILFLISIGYYFK
ncbi:MAG: hypothetical protein PHE25_00495 [Candidatus Gracilibacteria bacterium]|nr:hypothetical protein [Candidatus Gracilibacteria bacterium]